MQEKEPGIAESGKLEVCILCVLTECFGGFFNVNKHGVAETIHVSWQNLRVATCYLCSKISKHVAHVTLSAYIPAVPTSMTAPQSQVPMVCVGPFTIYLF